jgi:hypothetical protein
MKVFIVKINNNNSYLSKIQKTDGKWKLSFTDKISKCKKWKTEKGAKNLIELYINDTKDTNKFEIIQKSENISTEPIIIHKEVKTKEIIKENKILKFFNNIISYFKYMCEFYF